MGTPEFLNVLRNFSGISTKDAEYVLTLKEQYPFSQVLHALAARVSRDHSIADSAKELQLAAVYAADRTILKAIMETRPEIAPVSETILLATPVETGPIDYAEELIHDMERLNELRNNFELLFVDGAATSFVPPPPKQEEPEAVVIKEEPVIEKTETKSKKERIRELARSVSNEGAGLNESSLRGRKRRKDSVEALINDIVGSKEELTPESEKQKEQIELIDHFIKAQPTISGTKEKQSGSEDLSSIKAGDFNDSIISETLVEILLKQGKKDKAVEVLKKLIWKFPQKKAYFASQIEDLKK